MHREVDRGGIPSVLDHYPRCLDVPRLDLVEGLQPGAGDHLNTQFGSHPERRWADSRNPDRHRVLDRAGERFDVGEVEMVAVVGEHLPLGGRPEPQYDVQGLPEDTLAYVRIGLHRLEFTGLVAASGTEVQPTTTDDIYHRPILRRPHGIGER